MRSVACCWGSMPLGAVLAWRNTSTRAWASVALAPCQKSGPQKKSTTSHRLGACSSAAWAGSASRASRLRAGVSTGSRGLSWGQSFCRALGGTRPDSSGLDAGCQGAAWPSAPASRASLTKRSLPCAAHSAAQAMRWGWASSTRLAGTGH